MGTENNKGEGQAQVYLELWENEQHESSPEQSKEAGWEEDAEIEDVQESTAGYSKPQFIENRILPRWLRKQPINPKSKVIHASERRLLQQIRGTAKNCE